MSTAKPGLARILRTANAGALVAAVLGLVHAVRTIGPRTWVLEFQAGPASSTLEKANAVVQSVAIEVVGYFTIALALAALAHGLARVHRRWRADEQGSGYAAALILCAGAFFGWVDLAWLADDALAFLTRAQVLALDAAGIGAMLLGLLLYDALVARLSWSPRASEPVALAALALAKVATDVALRVLKSGEQGWRDPVLLCAAGVGYLVALPLAGGLARLLAVPCAWVRARLARGPLLPSKAVAAAWVVLLVCIVQGARHFQLSPLRGVPRYATLPARAAAAGAPNVVFVTIDTLRADHLSCYGYARPTSPFLDTLAAQGVRCADASAAAAWTKPATGTILTGLYPSRHGALYHGSLLHLPEGERTLAQAFQERGYVTAGFVANPNLKRVFDFDRGFDVYFDSPVEDTLTLACLRGTYFGQLLMRLLRHQFNWNYENDFSSMNREVLTWLDQNHASQPFFLYAHYIDPHIPYDPPARYREEFAQDHPLSFFNERKRRVGIDLYDGEIRYSDDGLKELVGALQRHGVWENTLFVLTSDHGEEFFEHGVIGHGFSLYQEVVHVPLVLRGPGVPAGRVLEAPVQILDLAATVLSLAGPVTETFGDGRTFHRQVQGLQPPPEEDQFLESEFGQDDTNQREFVFSGVRSGAWKLVLTEQNEFFPPSDPRYGHEALYHLETDPSERRNLFREEEHKELVSELLARLTRHSQFLQEQGFRDVAPAALTPEMEASLRALGYLGGKGQ